MSTLEQKVQQLLGVQLFQLCALQTDVESLRDENAKLKIDIEALKAKYEPADKVNK